MFITKSSWAGHPLQPRATQILYKYPTLPWTSSLILSFYQCLDRPCGLFSSRFSTKFLYHHFLLPYFLHAIPTHSSWFDTPDDSWWVMQIIQLLIMILLRSTASCSHLNPNIPPLLFEYPHSRIPFSQFPGTSSPKSQLSALCGISLLILAERNTYIC